jgi:hypothetical protein
VQNAIGRSVEALLSEGGIGVVFATINCIQLLVLLRNFGISVFDFPACFADSRKADRIEDFVTWNLATTSPVDSPSETANAIKRRRSRRFSYVIGSSDAPTISFFCSVRTLSPAKWLASTGVRLDNDSNPDAASQYYGGSGIIVAVLSGNCRAISLRAPSSSMTLHVCWSIPVATP